ncbi:MAG TPA: GAF domain-containing protein [Anaerolineales bacterium]|nr:GAF domain-containing protein [Anaerolineales bacterium]
MSEPIFPSDNDPAALNGLAADPSALLRNLTDHVVVLDERFAILYLNHVNVGRAGHAPIGRPVLDFVPPEMQALGRAVLAQAESGQISRMELRYASPVTGQDYLYDVQVIPIGGEPRRYQVIAADITPRRTAEANLRASQERVQALMRHSHGIVGVLDAEGRILHAAGTTQRETGFSADQLTGRALIAFLHPGDRALLHSQIREAMAQPGVATPPFEVRGNPRFHPARVFECVLTDLREMPEVGGFLISGHDVTHRKQAEENLRRQHAEAALLNEVSQALSRLAPAEEVLNILATNLPRVLDATSIYVGLVDETQRELSFPLLLHQGERQPPQKRSFGQGVTEYVIRTRQGLLLNTSVADFVSANGLMPPQGPLARSFLGVPMLAGEHVIGMIGAQDSERRGAFRAEHLELLSSVAAQAAAALDNARLVESLRSELAERALAEARLEQQAHELSALYRASTRLLQPGESLAEAGEIIAAVLIDEFNLADCGVLIVDQASGQLRRLARRGSYTVRATAPLLLDGAGLTVEAVRTGTAVYSPDVTADPRYVPNEPRTRSELAVPLRSGGQVIGVLDLQSDRLDGFDARARRLIDAFADQVALAVANVLLLERLDEARQAAEESNQIKSEFLANTSHELRTPLTAILGSLNLLLNDEVDDAEQGKHFAQIAHDAATNLLRIVNDLLDIARIEAGRIELSLKPVDVAGALAEAYMLMWVQADAKRLSLDMQIPAEPIAVRADAARLGQILINLIGNAIKFTAEGKVSVTVEADRTSGLARIQVLDTGIGVAPDKQPRLFEPFVQADGTSQRRYGGTGLGLSISRRLAEMMGGTLELTSPGLGHGTAVTLTLALV